MKFYSIIWYFSNAITIFMFASLFIGCYSKAEKPSIVQIKSEIYISDKKPEMDINQAFVIYNYTNNFDSMLKIVTEFNTNTLDLDTVFPNYRKFVRVFFINDDGVDSNYSEDLGFIPDRLSNHEDVWAFTFRWERCRNYQGILQYDTMGKLELEPKKYFNNRKPIIYKKDCY